MSCGTSTVMDAAGIEQVDVAARGGGDNLAVGDLTGTGVTEVNADLQTGAGTGAPDGRFDIVTVDGTDGIAGNDQINVDGKADASTVSGLAALVRIAHADGFDRLNVDGLGGSDTISAAKASADAALDLTLAGGANPDHLIGGVSDDVLAGGNGGNVIEGGRGHLYRPPFAFRRSATAAPSRAPAALRIPSATRAKAQRPQAFARHPRAGGP